MSEILDEFWIFSKEGEGLVNFYRDPNGNGSFSYRNVTFSQHNLSVIKTLIIANLQKSSKEKKNIVRFEDDIIRYGQCLENDLIICYKPNPNVKENLVLKLCKTISRILEDDYPNDKMQFWDGQFSFFDKFKNKLSLYFKMSSL
jgi:hypothetical protein